ncbi:MAG: TetR/AcrR family transcriptional regulator [Pseudonocardiales bacterium]|nr:TetR/AcrR family transcriptional regulator [Pseudonocardiales bacterium]
MVETAQRIDHRTRPRRRGQVLNQAIFAAAMTELAEVGYAHFTMGRVAERAGTGRASLYRRWPGRGELVLDAVRHVVGESIDLADHGELRADLLALLGSATDVLAGPVGEAMRGLLADSLHDPGLTRAARSHVPGAGDELVLEILRRGAVRGEVRPQALTPRVAGVGPALLRLHFLVHGAPIGDEVLAEIVDEVILPLVRI